MSREAMLEDSAIAARIHNIVHATGHGVQLTPADTLRYNNLANMDHFITFGQSLNAPQQERQADVIGLHTDMSTLLSHPEYTKPKQKAMYFDGTLLERDNDALVALSSSSFDSMQRSQAVAHYGLSNTYDIRGFAGVQYAQDAQRKQFKAVEVAPELRNRVNPAVVNDTTAAFQAPQVRPPLDEKTLPARNADANVPETPSYYPAKPMSSETPSWYEPLEQKYVAEEKEKMMREYVISAQSGR